VSPNYSESAPRRRSRLDGHVRVRKDWLYGVLLLLTYEALRSTIGLPAALSAALWLTAMALVLRSVIVRRAET